MSPPISDFFSQGGEAGRRHFLFFYDKGEGGYIDVHSSAANWSSGQIFITSIHISLIIFLFFILDFQKHIASICLKKIRKGYMFLKA